MRVEMNQTSYIKRCLFGACMIGVAATSYSLNNTVYTIHWAFATTLTIFILATIAWLIKRGSLARLDYALIVFTGSLWLLGRAALKISATQDMTGHIQ